MATRAANEEIVNVLKTEVCRLNSVLRVSHLRQPPASNTSTNGCPWVVENVIRLIRPQAAEQQVQITFLHPEKKLPLIAC